MPSRPYCPIRRTHVSTLPEELVRVQLVKDLIEKLGYPASGIAIEKELAQMPHLCLQATDSLPQRRADIICFAKGIHPQYDLYPLMLIECKAVKLTHKMIKQVVGYNHYVKSYFLALVNQDEIRMGWYDRALGGYQFISRLPSYDELLAACTNNSL